MASDDATICLNLADHSESSLRLAISAPRDLPLEVSMRCSAIIGCTEKAAKLSRKMNDMRTALQRELHARMRVPHAERDHHAVFANMKKDQRTNAMLSELRAELQEITRAIADTTFLQMRGTCSKALAAIVADTSTRGWLALNIGGDRLARRSARGLASVAVHRAIPAVALRRVSDYLENGVAVRTQRAPFTLGAVVQHRDHEPSSPTSPTRAIEFEVTGLAPDCAFEFEVTGLARGRW